MKVSKKDLVLGLFCVLVVGGVIYAHMIMADMERQANTFQIGTSTVHRGEGASAADLSAVGEILKALNLFAETHSTFQICLRNRRYELRAIVRPGKELDLPADLLLQYRTIAMHLSNMLNNAPIDIHLCDPSFQTLRVIPYQPVRPPLPITIAFRPSVGGGGLVAQSTNTSGQYLALRLKISNATLGKKTDRQLKLRAKSMTELGWIEGWEYQSGETITLSHADYEILEVRVP